MQEIKRESQDSVVRLNLDQLDELSILDVTEL